MELDQTVMDLGERMETLAPWDSVRNVYTELFGYVKVGEFQTFQQLHEDKVEQLEADIDNRLTVEASYLLKGWTEDLVTRQLKPYA